MKTHETDNDFKKYFREEKATEKFVKGWTQVGDNFAPGGAKKAFLPEEDLNDASCQLMDHTQGKMDDAKKSMGNKKMKPSAMRDAVKVGMNKYKEAKTDENFEPGSITHSAAIKEAKGAIDQHFNMGMHLAPEMSADDMPVSDY